MVIKYYGVGIRGVYKSSRFWCFDGYRYYDYDNGRATRQNIDSIDTITSVLKRGDPKKKTR